jgi:O-antigen/teichoic acid export membrane protein
LLNVALNATLIPRFGMNGAAVATSIAYGSMFGLLVWAARRIGYDPLVDIRPVRIGATAVSAGLLIVAVDDLITSDVLALVVVPVVGAGLYGAAAILTGAIDVDEVVGILDQLPIPYEFAVDSRG